MTGVPEVHVILPAEVNDPNSPSGGNTYDRRVCQGLARSGWPVRERVVPGTWPRPDAAARRSLARTLSAIPAGAVALLDGLVACAAPEIVAPQAGRLRMVVLVHLPLGDETGLSAATAADLDAWERRTLWAADAVVTTSDWAARRLVDHHALPAGRVHVAAPGVAPAPLAPGTDGATQLLCVAALTPRKGQDLLVEALAGVADRSFQCLCVGGWGRDPAFADRVRRAAHDHGLADRIRLVGPRTGAALAASYAAADLVVLPSRSETYGMVVTEALAHGIAVLATDVGGVPEALGRCADGTLPGMLVPPADPAALAGALRRWLDEPATRRRLRAAAHARRAVLPDWQATVRSLSGVLQAAATDSARVR